MLPGKGNESVGRPVAIPGRDAFGELPVPLPNSGLTQNIEQVFVERSDGGVHRFIWGAAQVRRDALESPIELALVKEAKARR